MKIFKKLSIVASSLLLGVIYCPLATFASSNNFDITYSGGADLGSSNVNVNSELISGLTLLMKIPGNTAVPKGNTARWRNGYIKENNGADCNPFKYIAITSSQGVVASDNIGFTVSNDKYDYEVDIKKVTTEALGSKTVSVGFRPDLSFIYGGFAVYSDANCNNLNTSINNIAAKDDVDDRLFIEAVIKLHKKGNSALLSSDQLYFGITDIDAAQSYKILNSGNLLSKDIMFTENAADLQPSTTLRNKFVESGHYIYSQYQKGGDPAVASSDNKANVYVKINQQTQAEGLDVVYGFAHAAGSGIVFRAKQYTVRYVAETGGRITGISSETVLSGENPSSSEKQPDDGYRFRRWIVDKDVTLEDGTVIRAGNPISEAQIKQVVVSEDITFTAQFTKQYKVDYVAETGGRITGIETENVDTGNNPSSTEKQPDEKYQFVQWIADEDVTLEDGTEIKAGEPITEEQIKQVVVNENLVFTAQFEKIKYKVDYEAKDGGQITGIKTEDVEVEENPSSSTAKPDKNYELDHWVADKDVTLEDGTEIKAGEPITEEQIKQVVVDQDLKFTAIFKKNIPTTPDTGLFTKVGSVVASSALGILVIALVIRSLPRLNHKKVKFE